MKQSLNPNFQQGLAHELRGYDEYIWLRLALECGNSYMETHDWRTQSKETKALLELGAVLHEDWALHGMRLDAVIEREQALAYVSVGMATGWIRIQVASAPENKDSVSRFISRVAELFPESIPDKQVPVVFWYDQQDDRATSVQRMMSVPTWEEIKANYPANTRASLDRLMNRFEPDARGQLLLWHGEPGTGKTWSLRALADAWKQWCWFEYITDPERFFGSAEYMMQVLLQGNERRRAPNVGSQEPWRLLILEDTGEMLAADAKNREGQKLSRLLNLVDGFIGQGLKMLILVTTNETLGSLHPAVSRPGRCAAVVEFRSFSPEEAGEWLETRGQPREPAQASLAELFARAAGLEVHRQARGVGFLPLP